MNQSGNLSREESHSFFAAVTPSDATTYGPANNTKAIDSLFFSATAAQHLDLVDQNNVTTVFTFGAAGTYVLAVSPSKVAAATNVTGIVAMYK